MNGIDALLKLDWLSIGAFFTILTGAVAAIMGSLRSTLKSSFVTHEDHNRLDFRVRNMEVAVNGLATKNDVEKLSNRVGALEVSTSRIEASISGIRDSVDGNGRQLEILTKHLLEKEAP